MFLLQTFRSGFHVLVCFVAFGLSHVGVCFPVLGLGSPAKRVGIFGVDRQNIDVEHVIVYPDAGHAWLACVGGTVSSKEVSTS